MPTSPKQKKSPRPLNAVRIAEAALDLIDAEGVEGLSARKLAGALGCEAMSIYHHVDGMDGVADAVVDLLLGSLIERRAHARDPRQALRQYAGAFLDLAEAHPGAMVLVGTRRWRTPNALAAASMAVGLMRDLGASPREALRRMRIFGAYLNGAALALTGWRRNAQPELDVAADSHLAPVTSALNAKAVRADLDAGIVLLLDALMG